LSSGILGYALGSRDEKFGAIVKQANIKAE
jgi:hypothetical protein